MSNKIRCWAHLKIICSNILAVFPRYLTKSTKTICLIENVKSERLQSIINAIKLKAAIYFIENVKSERLQSIINAIKLKAEHLEAVTELTTCKEDLVNYRKKSDGLEGNCVEYKENHRGPILNTEKVT